MKTILLLIPFLFYINNPRLDNKKGKSIKLLEKVEISGRKKMEVYRSRKYKEVIEILKKYEGFRATAYDDGGYPCIGYGQRVAFFKNFKIKDKINEQEASYILKKSFDNHVQLAKHYFPGLNKLQQYSVAHMSYTIGIGNVIKYKYLYKEAGIWKINKERLYNARKVDAKKKYREIRQYEYKLFNTY